MRLSLIAAPLLAASALAKANLPALPADLTTPFQQRLAIYGPNGKTPTHMMAYIDSPSRVYRMEYVYSAEPVLRGVWYLS